jgi:broad specificity phosphatase PhoE
VRIGGVFHRLPRLVLIPHADAGDRRTWLADQDTRPLSGLGVSQAAALAKTVGRVDAIISSPALRCIQTVEPIAALSQVGIETNEDLREITFADEVDSWDAWDLDPDWRAQLLAADAIGRALRVLVALDGHGGQRGVVVSAHGDLIPLLAMLAAGYFRVAAPPPIARGGCFEVDPMKVGQPISTLGARLPIPG